MQRIISIGVTVMLLCFLATGQDQQEQKRGPSTPEERKRFLAVVHKLEESPLDPGLNSDVQWAIKWIEDIPDINVTICPAPLGDLSVEDYRYKTRIAVQFTLGMGAFLIEHPDKTGSAYSQYLAGVQSALKSYRAILKSKPDAKSDALEKLSAAEKDGTLSDLVHEATRLCEDTNQT